MSLTFGGQRSFTISTMKRGDFFLASPDPDAESRIVHPLLDSLARAGKSQIIVVESLSQKGTKMAPSPKVKTPIASPAGGLPASA